MRPRRPASHGIIACALVPLLLLGSVALWSGCSMQGGLASARWQVPSYAMPSAADASRPEPEARDGFDRDRYDAIDENAFVSPVETPLSTFAIDVDTASYSNVRRFLEDGQSPPPGAVRIEELVNYFDYDDPSPIAGEPFALSTELARAPWNPSHGLLRIALSTAPVERDEVPACNLVFLVDVSGSMQAPDKLGLVKRGLQALVAGLRPQDRVALVVYAGASGVVLPSTSGAQRDDILAALDRLEAGGSTNGADGIRLAYDVARKNFDLAGINRVILATDGDFNVGITDRSELVRLIERERESGVFLTVLGVGRGNLNDAGMEELADHGNGSYAYLDSLAEARKVLVSEAGSTLVTVAKDVKIQVEFNPRRVGAYRLLGYENRVLADRDFDDDRKDAGEIGAGHSVTALYEIVPPGLEGEVGARSDIELRYQDPRGDFGAALFEGELALVKVRYKEPGGDRSRLLETPIDVRDASRPVASEDLRFGAAVALFGMLLRESPHAGDGDFRLVESLARDAIGHDPDGLRRGFLRLVDRGRVAMESRERERVREKGRGAEDEDVEASEGRRI